MTTNTSTIGSSAPANTQPAAQYLPAPKFLTEKQVAAEYNLSRSFLQKRRLQGGGPLYSGAGRSIRYAREDVDAWFADNRRASTSDTPSASGGKSRSKRTCGHCGCDCGRRV